LAKRLDERDEGAIAALERRFNDDRSRVFYSRQLEVMHEREFFHWVTTRALRTLEATGEIRSETRQLRTGALSE
jgi:hypothetical protein